MVSRLITAYQTQDVSRGREPQITRQIEESKADAQVICVKCAQSKDDNIAPTCHCGGSYKTSMNRGEAKNKLKMIQSGE